MYKKTTLANGLRIITRKMKDRGSISLGIWFNVGGRYEEGSIKGAAHFLEHIVFKGSQKYSCEKIKQSVEGVGGSLNAFTAEEQTCFYAKIPSKHLRSTFDVLADMAFFPKIASKDVEREKTVIIEEIKMYHDLPQYYVMEQLDSLVWPKHPLGKGIAGSIKSVNGMINKDLSRFHKTFYGPANAAIVACGNIDHGLLARLAQTKLKALRLVPRKEFRPAQNKQDKPQIGIENRNIEQMHLALGMFGCHQEQKERFALSLLSIILGGNMSSRLFVQVREKHGLAYSISSSMKPLKDTGLFMVRAGVDNTRLLKAIELIFKELDKAARQGVSANEFRRARDYMLGQLLVGLEDTMEHMLWMGESVMVRGRVRTMKEMVNQFKKVTVSDIKRIAKAVLNPAHYNLSLVGPVTEAQRKSLHTLLGLSK